MIDKLRMSDARVFCAVLVVLMFIVMSICGMINEETVTNVILLVFGYLFGSSQQKAVK